MSRIVAGAAIRGANTIAQQAEEFLQRAIKEKGEVITSSPALSPSDLTARWSPAVPDETAHEYLTPAYSAIIF